MRKAILSILTIAVLAAASIGCSFTTSERGSITLTVPANLVSSASGTKSLTGTQTVNTLRAYVVQSGSFLALSGASAGDPSDYTIPANNTVVISGIPQGSGYTLYIALGYKAAGATSADYFPVSIYGASSTFSVSAGVSTAVTVDTFTSNFTVISTGKNTSAAVVGSDLYLLAGGKLYKNDWSTSVATPSAYTVNSISAGYWWNDGAATPELWLNTGTGIVRYNGNGGFLENFLDSNNANPVLMSGAAKLADLSIVGFYAGSGHNIGGFASTGSSSTETTWGGVSTSLTSLDQSFQDLINKMNGNLVSSFAFTSNFIYLVTPINTYRFGVGEKNLFSATWLKNQINSVTSDFIISIPGVTIKVLGTDSGSLYIGTDKGLYFARVNDAGSVTSGPNQVSSSDKKEEIKLSVKNSSVNGSAYAAALTKAGSVLLSKDGGAATVLPFYAGLPSQPTDVLLIKDTASPSGLDLIVTGANGAVTMQVPAL
jgi:hypothetical protein